MPPSKRCVECGQVLPHVKAERRKKRKAEKKDGRLDARRAVRLALKAGIIKKGPCGRLNQDCNGKVTAHHHKGYDKKFWLTVEWVCPFHHKEADDEQAGKY